MTHYPSAKRVHEAMKKIADDTILVGPGKSASNPDEDWTDVDRVEVRTKDHGTAEFEVIEVALGQMNSMRLERDGVELVVKCNLGERGEYDRRSYMKRADENLTVDDLDDPEKRSQVMEITPA